MTEITVVSPAPIKGSGGIRTILTYAKALKDLSHDVTVAFMQDGVPLGDNPSDLIVKEYGITGLTAVNFPDGLKNAKLAVATRWDTPAAIRHHYSGPMVHLVQDIEGWFHPMGNELLTAENNFFCDSRYVTLGHWLGKKLQLDFGEPCYTMDFGYDTEVYGKQKPYDQRKKRVSFIYQPEKPRRCTRLGIEALGIVKTKHPDCEIVLYGNDTPPEIWFPATHIGLVSPAELNALYNDSRVGLCISASNPSRIPFEMTACGLPVVDIFRSNNLHDYTDTSGILLALQTPEALAKAVIAILEDPALGGQMSDQGAIFSKGRSLEREATQFADFVNAVAKGDVASPRSDLYPLYNGEAVRNITPSDTRAQTFCRQQSRAFQGTSGTTQAAVSSHPSNVLPVDTMRGATLSCKPSNAFEWDRLTFPHHDILQTHPVPDGITSAVLTRALPSMVQQVNASVRVANPRAQPMQFAIAVRAADRTVYGPDNPVGNIWENTGGSGWETVKPGVDGEVRLKLRKPIPQACDLHIAVRPLNGPSVDFAWCQWLSFTFLTVASDGDRS